MYKVKVNKQDSHGVFNRVKLNIVEQEGIKLSSPNIERGCL